MNETFAKKMPAAVVLLFASASILLACTNQSLVSPGISPELKHSWEVNFNRGDAAAVAALYAPDAQLLMSGSDPINGSAAIRVAVESMIASGVKVRIASSENVTPGDIAYVFGTYTIEDLTRAKEVEHGTYVEIWRLIKGRWKITRDINSTGAPAHVK